MFCFGAVKRSEKKLKLLGKSSKLSIELPTWVSPSQFLSQMTGSNRHMVLKIERMRESSNIERLYWFVEVRKNFSQFEGIEEV